VGDVIGVLIISIAIVCAGWIIGVFIESGITKMGYSIEAAARTMAWDSRLPKDTKNTVIR
jgi:hypothetical protein